MILTKYNVHPVNLTCSIDGTSTLELHLGSDTLSDYESYVFDELPETGAYEEAEITIADFTHSSQTHQVYAWEVLATGGLEQWTRESSYSRSGLHDDLDETEVLVIAVPPGISVPEPTSADGPPAPGTTQTTIRVKIRKQGSTPFGGS